MLRLACLAASAALLLSVDATGRRLPPATGSTVSSPGQSSVQPSAAPQQTAPTSPYPSSTKKNRKQKDLKGSNWLDEDSRLAILRSVDGEFAHAKTPLPGAKKGFHFKVGQPVDEAALRKALVSSGVAVNRGDNVQITRIDFVPQGVLVDINGGGKVRWSWRDHLQGGIGFPGQVTQTTSGTANDGLAGPAKTGATVYLDFSRPPSDLTADQLKQYLAVAFDFSRQRSAALLWVDTLAPEVQQAIKEKRPLVGMDREEVLIAMGRPERKVREHSSEGQDIEDWIYGHPPSQTTFVRFAGDKVSKINQYP